MPIAKLSTGINLYYESYGRGEAIVFYSWNRFRWKRLDRITSGRASAIPSSHRT
jgi:hypothetical protein